MSPCLQDWKNAANVRLKNNTSAEAIKLKFDIERIGQIRITGIVKRTSLH